MRKWIWIFLLALLGLAAGAAFLVVPWATRVAHQKAEERGLVLEMGRLQVGFLEADIKDVSLQLEGVTGVSVSIDQVHVDLSFNEPRIQRIIAEGGHIRLKGSAEELQSSLNAWRERHSKKSSGGEGTGLRREEALRAFDLTWQDAFEEGDEQVLRGINVDRGKRGQRIGIDLMEVTLDSLKAEVAGASFESPDLGFDLAAATVAEAAQVRLSYVQPEEQEEESLDGALGESNGPLPNNAEQQEAEDTGLGQSLKEDPARVTRLRAVLALIRERLIPRLPQSATIEQMHLSYRRGDDRLSVGPSRLTVVKNADAFQVAIEPKGDTKGTPLSLRFALPLVESEHAAELSVKGGPVSLATLGIQEGDFGITGVGQAQLQGSMKIRLKSDASSVTGGGSSTVSGLSLSSARLSDELVVFPRLSFKGSGSFDVDGGFYEIEEAELGLGETRFTGDFRIEKKGESVLLAAHARAPLVSCQALLESAPRGLLGNVGRMKFDGTFSLNAGVEADSQNLKRMRVRWDFKNACRAKAVPPALDPNQFRGIFRRQVIGAGNLPMQVEFGPLSPNWVPYDEVSPSVEAAILVSEDGRFFRHDGFDDRAIESAIRANTSAGGFVRGASTVSMQLAKNLYLSRSKTLARKLQEAALTSLLEQSFEKQQLLEIYVNIVEFGPSIYGIRQAAEHYFSTHPGRLTPAQSFFLISILPSPTRSFFDEAGNLSEGRTVYVRHLLEIAHKRGRLTDEELESALQEVLIFGQASSDPPAAEGDEVDPEDEDEMHSLTMPEPGALSPSAPMPVAPEAP